MATCAYCHRHRGKRPCPALTAICSGCCGQHRQREIDCPSGCRYLVLAPPTGPPENERALTSALEKLIDFTMRARDAGTDAAVEAWFAGSERTVEEWETTSFLGYLAYGHSGEHGDRAIDRFLRERSGDLSTAEHEALRAIQREAWVSLFEVLAVRTDVGLDLLDRVTGQRVFVREKAGTRDASEGDHLLGWVVPLPDHAALTGAVCHVPAGHVGAVETAIVAALGSDLPASPDDSRHARLGAALPDIHRQLRHAVRHREPRVFGPTGEEILICRAIYEATDPEAIRSRLTACPELVHAGGTRFLWCRAAGGASDDLDLLGEVELRTVRLSLFTPSRSLMEEGKRLLARLLGSLVQHRVDRVEDLTGKPAERKRGSDPASPIAGIPPQRALARDVDAVIADFNRQLGARVIASVTSPATRSSASPAARDVAVPAQAPGGTTPDASVAREPDRIRSIDPKARTHRLPPIAHEVLNERVPDLGPLVREVAAGLRRRASWESVTASPPELVEIEAASRFLRAHAHARYRSGWSEEAAMAEADLLGAHLRYLVNFELHGRKIFWVDEALAWMLSETELDIVGRCLRLPFPASAFVFTDPGTLELGQSLLSLESQCPVRNEPLHIVTVYVTRGAPVAEAEPQDLNISFLFDARTGAWPYLVSRDLFVGPDDHLAGILDSRAPDVSPEGRDPVFLAPELKKLVHLVINAILYATSAHLDPIVLRSEIRPLEVARASKGPGKRARLERRAAALRRVRSAEDVYHLPGHIDISRVKLFRALPKTESGRALLARFMVRGHWRRANPDWKDQRLRWIEPYWKGPELATVIERDYRLRP